MSRTVLPTPVVLSLPLTVCTLAVGCVSDANRPAWQGEVLDSAGIRVVHNPATPEPDPEGGWVVREELRIGSESDAEEAVVGRPVDAVEAPDGSVLVLDQIGRDVKVYDSGGRFDRVISRPGEGPGELGRPGSLWSILMAGDTVLVPDPLQRRVSRFSVAGDYLGLIPLPGSFFGVRWERDASGRLLVETSTPFRDEDGLTRSRVDVLRYDPSTSTVDTLVSTDPTWNHWGSAEVLDYPLLVANAVWAVLGGGRMAWGATHRSHLDVAGPGGGIELRITHPVWAPRRVPGDLEGELRERYRAYRESLGPSRDPRRKAMHLGQETAPTYTAVFGGPEGTLWVQRAHPLLEIPGESLNQGRADRMGSSTWDVFGDDGVFRGTVDFPTGFRLMSVRGQRLLGVREGPNGEAVVVRMRVERAVPGSAP